MTSEQRLKAPFPYSGGKSRWSKIIWPRLGTGRSSPIVYVEPFAGSLAVLLASEPHEREIVCDTSGHIVNFWRAVQWYPDEVAKYADWPTFHDDLTARHRWLRKWSVDMSHQLRSNPTWCDPKAAGFWCWGISNWIGGGFAEGQVEGQRPFVMRTPHGQGVQVQAMGGSAKVPHISSTTGSKGVSVQSIDGKRPLVQDHPGGKGVQVQGFHDKRPYVRDIGGGRGVQVQTAEGQVPKVINDLSGSGVQVQTQIQRVNPRGGGNGVQAQTKEFEGQIGDGTRLMKRMRLLQQRLARVVVLNRDWSSAVTDTLLMHTPSSPKPPVAIFLDPPYRTEGRSTTLYGSDLTGTSDDSAVSSWEWAVENGDRYRIAYACHEGDIELPDGWTSETMSFRHGGGGRRDLVAFSPACIKPDGFLEQPQMSF